jgi:hypothetical protein
MSALVVLQREVRASGRLWLVVAVAFFAGFQLLQLALLIIWSCTTGPPTSPGSSA